MKDRGWWLALNRPVESCWVQDWLCISCDHAQFIGAAVQGWTEARGMSREVNEKRTWLEDDTRTPLSSTLPHSRWPFLCTRSSGVNLCGRVCLRIWHM
jgi:hypothetical protein